MKDLSQAVANRQAITDIKRRYNTGEISREEAKTLAQPILNKINTKTAEVAKRHRRKPYKLDFISAMRNGY